jgi:hypothetical protein
MSCSALPGALNKKGLLNSSRGVKRKLTKPNSVWVRVYQLTFAFLARSRRIHVSCLCEFHCAARTWLRHQPEEFPIGALWTGEFLIRVLSPRGLPQLDASPFRRQPASRGAGGAIPCFH